MHYVHNMTWAPLITAVAGLMSVAIATLTYRRGNSSKRLLYRVSTLKISSNMDSPPVYISTVAIMNTGRHDVEHGDFDNNQPTQIDLGTQILGTFGAGYRDRANRLKLDCAGTCVTIRPTLIAARAFVLKRFITRHPPAPILRRSLVNISVELHSKSFRNTVCAWGVLVPESLWFGSSGVIASMKRTSTYDATAQAILSLVQWGIIFLAVGLWLGFAISYLRGPAAFKYKIWSALRTIDASEMGHNPSLGPNAELKG